MTLLSNARRHSSWWRWLRRRLIAFALFIGGTYLFVWWHFEHVASEGKAELAAAIAETDALDPDLPPEP
jgi:hypothetical protein